LLFILVSTRFSGSFNIDVASSVKKRGKIQVGTGDFDERNEGKEGKTFAGWYHFSSLKKITL